MRPLTLATTLAVVFAAPAAAAPPPVLHLILVVDSVAEDIRGPGRADVAAMKAVFADNVPAAQLRVTEVDLLTAGGKPPGRSAELIRQAIGRAAPGPNDALVFYYTGHGAYDDKGHFLALPRGGVERVYRQDTLALLRDKQPRLAVQITDCCHKYLPLPLKPRGLAPGAAAAPAPPPKPPGPSPLFDTLFFRPTGVVDLTSSDKNQVSLMVDGRYSLFTAELTDFLGGNAQSRVPWADAVSRVRQSAERTFRREFPGGHDGQAGHTLKAFVLEVTDGGGPPPTDPPVFGVLLRSRPGALVLDVTADSPADKAGLKPGDVIVRLNGKPVDGAKGFADLADTPLPPAGRLSVLRPALSPNPESIRWDAIELPVQPGVVDPKFGLKVAPRPGAQVVEVKPNTPAARAGVKIGDVLYKVDGKPVTGAAATAAALKATPPPATVDVLRGNQPLTLKVR